MSGGQPELGFRLRRDLMDIVHEITFPELNLAADKMFPALNVTERSAEYPVLPRGVIMKIPDTSRSPGGTYARGQWEYGSGVYTTKEYGFEEPVDLVRKIENKMFLDEEEVSAELAVQGLLLGRESRVSSAIVNANVFNATNDNQEVAAAWIDAVNATPWKDIDNAYKKSRGKNGMPKRMCSLSMTDDMIEAVIRTKEIKESVQYTDPVATYPDEKKRSFLANYFGVKEVIPTMAMFDSNKLGDKTVKISKFWSNNFAMLYIPSAGRQTFKERCLGRQINYKPYSQNYVVDEYAEPQAKRKIIRACEYRGLIINLDYGVLIKGLKPDVDADTNI